MSEETIHAPGAVMYPEGNSHDGSEAAYEKHDAAEELKGAFNAEESDESESELEPQQTESEDSKFAEKFAALSRREKEIRQLESQFKEKMSLLDERLQSLNQPEEPEEEEQQELPLEYRLKKNPLETLKELGIGYDKLTEMALNDGKLPQEMQMQLMREELESQFESKVEEIRSQLTERDKQAEQEKYDKVVNDFKSQIEDFVTTNTEEYELIRANNSSDLVFDVIESYHEETGEVMDIKDAADQVENYLLEEAERIFNKTQKLKQKFGISQEQAEKIVESQEPTEKPQSPTLSNTQSTVVSKKSSPKSRDESLHAAASLLKWND